MTDRGAAWQLDVDPLLGSARDRARDGERRPLPFDDVQLLHPEGLARPDDGRPIVGVVRSVEYDRHAVEPPPDDLPQPFAPGLGHQRLEHAHQELGIVRLGTCDAHVHELVRAEDAGGRAPHGTGGYSRNFSSRRAFRGRLDPRWESRSTVA